jgi:molybdopterin/thiamine biosynthesis adenylyltransferase
VSSNRSTFDYLTAFDRNIGFVTEAEQLRLRHKTVAIAGAGGVGGANLLTLARLGIGGFHLADLDHFELANFNRQVGATVRTLGKAKVEVMAEMAHDIQPSLRIRRFSEGVTTSNLDTFLEGVDLFIDGLDFFCQDIRAQMFRRCAELRIPAITAAPIGMGTSYLLFVPGGMTFDEYFGVDGHDYEEQMLRFATGLLPRELHRGYLVDPSRMDVRAGRVSSSSVGIQIASAAVGAEAIKLLLGRGRIRPAPWCHQFDIYTGRWVQTRVVFGHRNPMQMARRTLLRRAIGSYSASRVTARQTHTATSPLERILELARWTPSGDNGQPWRFECNGDDSVRVHLRDESSHDIFDFDGRPSLLSGGMLVETMRLAASQEGRRLEFDYRRASSDLHLIDITFHRDERVRPDPLADFVHSRSVDRRPYRRVELEEAHRIELEKCLGDQLAIRWMRSPAERLHIARINALSSAIRLQLPEAAAVHARVVRFDERSSQEGIPGIALGFDPFMLKAVQLAIQHPQIAAAITRVFGAGLPSLEMDILPGLLCSAHFLITANATITDGKQGNHLLQAGMRLQRFWLRATSLGLALQPNIAPLMFAYHADHGRRFEHVPGCDEVAKRILADLRSHMSAQSTEQWIFAGRVGVPQSKPPQGRSLRKPLSELLLTPLRKSSSQSNATLHQGKTENGAGV